MHVHVSGQRACTHAATHPGEFTQKAVAQFISDVAVQGKATKDTVHWGFFSKDLPAKLEIESGQFITIARNPEGPHGLTV